MKTTRRTVAVGILFSTGALTAVLMTGCQGALGAGGPAPSATGAGSSAPPTDAPTTSSPGAVGRTMILGSQTTTPSPTAPRCKAEGLQLSLGPPEGAAGHIYQALEFINRGSTRCTIAGFPGVSYVTGDNGRQIGAPGVRDGQIGAPVTLAPGQLAHSTLDLVDVGVFDQSTCRPTPVSGLRVYVPDDTVPVYIARAGTGCAGRPPSAQLRVQTVTAGVGGG